MRRDNTGSEVYARARGIVVGEREVRTIVIYTVFGMYTVPMLMLVTRLSGHLKVQEQRCLASVKSETLEY